MSPAHTSHGTSCRLVDLEGMRTRRSLADAFHVLRTKADISDPRQGRFGISPLRLPSGQFVYLVSAHFEDDAGAVYVVPLPSCTRFRAILAGESAPDEFSIKLLIDATIEPAGTVRLADGRSLRSLEIIPAALPLEPTKQQWKIVHGVMAAFGFKHVYRSLQDATQCEKVPEYYFLDCGKLHDLPLPRLNEICYRLTQYDPTFLDISDKTIANALRTFGIRLPRSNRSRRSIH